MCVIEASCLQLYSSISLSDSGQPHVVDVSAGQLTLGELLVRSMYAAQPDVSSCSQQQLLQLLLLADRYGVPKVLSAVSTAFASIPTVDLQWEAVHAMYALPPGSAKMDVCNSLFEATGEKLQQDLGDLELVWADRSSSKQQLLKALSLGLPLQLLGDHRTRVACENTSLCRTPRTRCSTQ
jgi:hypothetical protein